jgi:uncharacterized RDD family membrane protein YckC
MLALEGLELATFSRRAGAILIEGFVAAAVFVILVGPAGMLRERLHPGMQARIVLTFGGRESNWCSLIFLTPYFTLSVYLTNGRPLGKRLCGICIVSTVHERISLWQRSSGHLAMRYLLANWRWVFCSTLLRPTVVPRTIVLPIP